MMKKSVRRSCFPLRLHFYFENDLFRQLDLFTTDDVIDNLKIISQNFSSAEMENLIDALWDTNDGSTRVKVLHNVKSLSLPFDYRLSLGERALQDKCDALSESIQCLALCLFPEFCSNPFNEILECESELLGQALDSQFPSVQKDACRRLLRYNEWIKSQFDDYQRMDFYNDNEDLKANIEKAKTIKWFNDLNANEPKSLLSKIRKKFGYHF